MFFAHLLKLSMPANLKKRYRSYINHCWDRIVLRNEHIQSVQKVEQRLKRLGEDKTKTLKWIELRSLLKQMGYKTTSRDRKMILFCKLKEHMVRRSLWKKSSNPEVAHRRGNQGRKRKFQKMEVEYLVRSRMTLRTSKRLRSRNQSKNGHDLQSLRASKRLR